MSRMTNQEELMASIWSGVLGQPIQAPESDFIALGGSSLLAMQVAAEATHAFGTHVSVVDVLMSASLRELVTNIQSGAATGALVR